MKSETNAPRRTQLAQLEPSHLGGSTLTLATYLHVATRWLNPYSTPATHLHVTTRWLNSYTSHLEQLRSSYRDFASARYLRVYTVLITLLSSSGLLLIQHRLPIHLAHSRAPEKVQHRSCRLLLPKQSRNGLPLCPAPPNILSHPPPQLLDLFPPAGAFLEKVLPGLAFSLFTPPALIRRVFLELLHQVGCS
jgi:hypothetical protein